MLQTRASYLTFKAQSSRPVLQRARIHPLGMETCPDSWSSEVAILDEQPCVFGCRWLRKHAVNLWIIHDASRVSWNTGYLHLNAPLSSFVNNTKFTMASPANNKREGSADSRCQWFLETGKLPTLELGFWLCSRVPFDCYYTSLYGISAQFRWPPFVQGWPCATSTTGVPPEWWDWCVICHGWLITVCSQCE